VLQIALNIEAMILIPRAITPTLENSTTLSYQPFCHNAEGWGPLSVFRYDFTPCFLDVPHAVIALFGIIAGALTTWWLLMKKSKQPTEKDWHYYAKLVCQIRL
jgi:ATP-binding cassette, subfamily C (CFTR/MRP), member 1